MADDMEKKNQPSGQYGQGQQGSQQGQHGSQSGQPGQGQSGQNQPKKDKSGQNENEQDDQNQIVSAVQRELIERNRVPAFWAGTSRLTRSLLRHIVN